MRSIEKVIPYARNPRKNEAAVDAVAASIAEFGFQQPIVVDAKGVIVCGDTRYKAARRIGMTEVPVQVATGLTPAQVKAYRIADNRLSEIAEWDEDLLALEVEELKEQDPDLDLSLLLGFTERELNELLDGEGEPGLTEPDDIPEPPEVPVTEPGDMWLLGEHRLLCGDCTKAADVERLMGKEKVSLLATDPPYFVDYGGKDFQRPKKAVGKSLEHFHDIPAEKAAETVEAFLSIALSHARKNPAIYVWHAHSRFHIIREVFGKLGIIAHQQIIWVKPTLVLGHSIYAYRHEPCVFGWKKGKKPTMVSRKVTNTHGTVWVLGLARTGDPAEEPEFYQDIWELDWEGSGRAKEKGHPTVKPVEVFAIPMRMHTRPGDVCYEPFCGSGTQIIAAEQHDRRCFAVEIEPVYCDVAVRRWEEFTGTKARKEKGDDERSD